MQVIFTITPNRLVWKWFCVQYLKIENVAISHSVLYYQPLKQIVFLRSLPWWSLQPDMIDGIKKKKHLKQKIEIVALMKELIILHLLFT